MTKKANTYQLSLRLISDAHSEVPAQEKSTEFQFENHDEIFEIIDRVQSKQLFEDEQQAQEFAIGLKMFSEVMIKNRKHPLFEKLSPAFASFMKKLKQA